MGSALLCNQRCKLWKHRWNKKCFGDNGADYKKSTYELGVADNENHDKHTGLVRSFGSHFNRIVL